MSKALFWEKAGPGKVRCLLCAHRCLIGEGKVGLCGVRENKGGELFSLSYGRLAAASPDPIEKKPFFHILPGSRSFSVATPGCNMSCLHCQNSDLSQGPREGIRPSGRRVDPDRVIEAACSEGCRSVAYTYSEPTIFYEYAAALAHRAAARGLKNLFVTNGYMSSEVLREASEWLDGANVDLKAFDDEFYRQVCGARLQPVLDTLSLMKELGIWLEVTTLIIPGRNDKEARLRELARFLVSIDPGIPWHITAFRPTYRLLDAPPTSASSLWRIREIGREAGLKYVYTGNIPGQEGENTVCPSCQQTLIIRHGFILKQFLIKDSVCPFCGALIPGIWE